MRLHLPSVFDGAARRHSTARQTSTRHSRRPRAFRPEPDCLEARRLLTGNPDMIITASSNVPTVVAGAGGVFELGARLDATDISQLSTQYAITVNWVITGTAVPGVDYPVDSPPTSGTAHLSFPVGAGGIVIPFSTIAVPGHNSETMTLHIVSASTSPDTYCDIGPDATVTIQSLIGVDLSSPTGGDTTKAVVPVDSKDPDGDGVPAFAEGFTPHAAGASANAKADVPPFTPITLDVTGTAEPSPRPR